MICPSCQFVRREQDAGSFPGCCPQCGIAYNKFGRARYAENDSVTTKAWREQALYAQESWWQRFRHYACFMPSDRHESAFWGHVVIFFCFVIWGWYFIFAGVDIVRIGGSFLHGVDQAFHAYGHLMFSHFGNYLELMGGSIFQVWAPLFPLTFFMVWQRDNFAASIMLWWCGQSFIDIAAYIADAPSRVLPLMQREAMRHDWAAYFQMEGGIDNAGGLAARFFFIGAVIIICSNFWGGRLLWIEFQGRTRPQLQHVTDDESSL